VEDPAAFYRRGSCRERREVRAGAGLAEELAPDLPRVEDRGQPAQLLLVGSVREERGPGEVDAGAVDELRGARARVLHVVDRDLDRCRAAAAVFERPVDGDPAITRELGLPRAPPLDLLLHRR